jgi:putative redox protein
VTGSRSPCASILSPSINRSRTGEDSAPTPTELFVSSLAACVAFYARRYLTRHGLPEEGLAVEADYEFAPKQPRVGTIRIRLRVPEGVPSERLAALHAVASHCTVHNTLQHPPDVDISLDREATESAA